MTREVTDNLYIELEYFTPEEYYTYIAEAACQLNAQAQVTADNDRIKDFDSSQTAFASVTCDATAIVVKNAEASLSANFNQTTDNTRIRDALAPLGTAFNSTMTVSALRITDVTLVTEAFFTTDFVVNRSATVALANIINVSSQSDRIRDYTSSITATASQTVQAEVIRSTPAALNTAFTQTAQANRTRETALSASAVFTQSTVAARTTTGVFARSAAFTQTAIGNRVNRNLGDASVFSGGVYSGIGLTTEDKKWNTGSLKIDPNSTTISGNDVVFFGSTYYIVAQNYTWTSTDGTTWTRSASDLNISFPSVQVLNNRLVVFSSNTIKTSTNGTTWTSFSAPSVSPYTATISHLTFNNGLWIVVLNVTSFDLGIIISTSPDLITWTQRVSNISSGYTEFYIWDVAVSGTYTYVLYNRIGATFNQTFLYRSTNATSWSSIAFPDTGTVARYLTADNSGNVIATLSDSFTYYTLAAGAASPTVRRTSSQYIGRNAFYNANNNIWYNYNDFGLAYTSTNTFPTFSWTGGYDTHRPPTKIQGNVMYGLHNNSRFMTTTDAQTYTYDVYDGQENLIPYIEYANNTDFSNWKTIDFWVRTTVNGEGRQVYIGNSTLQSRGWYISLTFNPTSTGISLQNYSSQTTSGFASGTYTSNTNWNHIRIAYDNNLATLFVNGVRATGTNAALRNVGSQRSLNGPLDINYTYFIGATDDSNAGAVYIDEFLITDELLTSPSATTYTVPTGPYTNTDSTDILLHFDGTLADDNTAPPRTVSASLQLNAAFTQSTQARADFSGSAALASTATLTCAANYTADSGIVDIPIDFYQTAEATRIFPLSAQFDVIASQLTAAARVGKFLVSANAEFTQSADAVATLDSTIVDIPIDFYQTTDIDRTRGFDATLSSTVAQNTVAEKTAVFDSTQLAEFTQIVNVDRTRDNTITAATAFTQTADAVKIVDSDLVDIPIDFYQTVDGDALRDAVILMETLAIKLAVVGKIGEGITDLNSAFTFTATAEVTSGSVINAQSQFTANATALRIKPLDSALTSQFTATVDAETVTVASSTQTSAFTQTTAADRTRGFDLSLNTDVNVTIDAAKTTTNAVTMLSVFTQTTDADVVADAVIFKPVTAVMGITAIKTAVAESQQSTVATLTAQGDVGNIGEAHLQTAFTLTATPAKTAQFIVFEPVVVQSNIIGAVIRPGLVQSNSQFTQNAVAQRTRTSTVSLTAFYSQLTVGSEVNSAQALLNSQFALSADVRIIVIDAALTYKIPKESRSYKIVEEIREYRIIEEIRSHTITDN